MIRVIKILSSKPFDIYMLGADSRSVVSICNVEQDQFGLSSIGCD
jgi:hypothetical protein